MTALAEGSEGAAKALTTWLDAAMEVSGKDVLEVSGDSLKTPLMGAAASGNVKMVEQLLERGCNINGQEERTGRTALMAACDAAQPKVVRLLLERRAKPDVRNAEGRTALDELRSTARSRVLAPLEFIRSMECTKSLCDHIEAAEDAVRSVPRPEGCLSEEDEQSLEDWVQRVDMQRNELRGFIEENTRRSFDHEGALTSLVAAAAGRNLLDRTQEVAAGFKRNAERGRNARGLVAHEDDAE